LINAKHPTLGSIIAKGETERRAQALRQFARMRLMSSRSLGVQSENKVHFLSSQTTAFKCRLVSFHHHRVMRQRSLFTTNLTKVKASSPRNVIVASRRRICSNVGGIKNSQYIADNCRQAKILSNGKCRP
jgi:hypothetical protein